MQHLEIDKARTTPFHPQPNTVIEKKWNITKYVSKMYK